MDKQKEICDIFRALGYDGDFPETLDQICNSSKFYLWDQFIKNTKSKIYVESIRNNIIISRLSKSALNKDKKYQYPVKEVDLYLRKTDLEKELLNLSYSSTEKRYYHLLEENKNICFCIEKLNINITEIEEREFILKKKLALLEKDIQDAESIFNIPIIYLSDEKNAKTVRDTLNNCEEKLQNDIKQMTLPIKNSIETKQIDVKNTKACLFSDVNDSIKIHVSDSGEYNSVHMDFNDDEQYLVNLSKVSTNKFGLLTPYLTKKNNLVTKNINVLSDQYTIKQLINKVHNENVNKEIRDLLHKYNCSNIWNIFQDIDINLHSTILEMINTLNIKYSSANNCRAEDSLRLKSLHVLTEFKIIKNNLEIRKLMLTLNRKKKDLKLNWLKLGYIEDIIENLVRKLELEIENIGLDISHETIKREINIMKNLDQGSDISKKSFLEVKDKISLKRTTVTEYLDSIKEILLHIESSIKRVTSFCVRKLSPFSSDMTWCSLLTEKISAQEINIFKEFPLEYNRRCIKSKPCLYYKDMHTDKFLSNVDNNSLMMLGNILECPFSTPEIVLLNLLHAKQTLQNLRSIQTSNNSNSHKMYSQAELESKENYISHILTQFKTLIDSPMSERTLATSCIVQKITELWIEMPFKEFISPNRTVEEKDYKHYENLLNYYSNL